ncbi:HNH endonuclease signature motif containing protein [Sinorhizobium meliloti]|uniref:HNH endonuclease signature motif containing protein n=1 Tax=Rhizobium meliloti TaxID=382 RepID=UPI000FD85388|nr:HNH endonuclease signature motif containing protein [Sinorhizobium meliloti]RVL37999.1 HNH endonuclease [Sinorhizobium meliloti]
MNYQRIYNELIADRRVNPPSNDEYAEVHHILPRCLGGGDDAGNLIRLRPEDHFFAHLLLAKIYDTPAMWGAVMIMHTRKSKSEILHRKTRVAYGFSRRRYGQLCSEFRVGVDNPNYNPELVTLKHRDGTIASRTRMDWVVEYGMKHEWLWSLMRGRVKSSNGWMLPETDPKKTGVRSGRDNVQTDVKIRYWRHIDGRVAVSDNRSLATRHGLRINDLSGVIRGAHGHHRGWYLDGAKIGWSNKPNRKLGRDDGIYELVHVDGRKAAGNRRQISSICGIDSRQISAILLGSIRSSNGWMTPVTAASGYRNRQYMAANDNAQYSLAV